MTRHIALRRAFGVAVSALVVLTIACAEKTLAPSSAALSPRFTIQVTATARRQAEAQKLVILALYFSSPHPGDRRPDDSVHILDGALVDVTGAPQQLNLKVDLTTCLADPTRHGSHDACSMYIGALLEPANFDTSANDFFGPANDYQFVGPYDATPGHPPTLPAIDLSNSRFAVNYWEGDRSLQLGGEQAPGGLTGPITGASGGSGGATLFALTQSIFASSTPNAPSSFGAALSVYQNGRWREVNGVAYTGPNGFGPVFYDVAAFAPNDAYLAATNGVGLYHYDGTAITAVAGIGEPLRSVAVSSASPSGRYLVAGTTSGAVWVGDLTTATFKKYSISGLTTVDVVCINSGTEAFATSHVGGTTSVYRFDGTTWTSVPTPITSSHVDLQCLGPGQAYVGTTNIPGTLYRWNGTGWTALPGPSGAAGRNMNWGVASANEIYAVGDSSNVNRAYYRFDGTSWREVGRLSFTTNFSSNRIWADPRGGAAYVSPTGNGSTARVEMVTPTSVTVLAHSPVLRDVVMPTTTSAFVVGRDFFLAHWNGGRWSVDAPPPGTRTNRAMNGVWGTDPANVWAVGQWSTIVRWDGARWSVLSDSTRQIVPALDNYNAVWGTGSSVWAVGDATIVRCATTTSCAVSSPASGPLYGVWGTSATNVYAVGAGGRILHFDGASWTSMTSATGARLSRVTGTSANDVWAAGDTVVLHFDGTTWKNVTSSVTDSRPFPGYQTEVASGIPLEVGLWAANTGEVYYGSFDLTIMRGSGTFWGATPLATREALYVSAIAGVAHGCALAITDAINRNGGGAPHLLRGVGASGCLATPMSPPTSWP
jgi:hypothetical protein